MEKVQENNLYRASANGSYFRELKKGILPLSSSDERNPRAYSSQSFSKQHLPTPLTPLIGREQEVRAICALLQQPEVRLLTLTGPGGVGKTSLALQIAAEVYPVFTDGICFVSLAPICVGELLLPTIARALGLTLKQDYNVLAQMQAAMRDKHFLLLLDNFEHIADAAPQLKGLLTACPHLKILLTSRTVLRLLEEREFHLAPLALPDLAHLSSCEDLSQVAALSLFLQRARTTHPDFELTSDNVQAVAQICVRLDGLPLAIELAAARMKLFCPQSLLARLDHRLSLLTSGTRDAPERQRTLRKTMEWSYRLLTPEEQRLFRRLSVFVGGCSLQAIEAIHDASGKQDEPLLDTLTSLLNQSLLQRERQTGDQEQRFTMLETIREYALECLQNSDEEVMVRQAHAEHYLTLAKTTELRVIGRELPHWIEPTELTRLTERLESECENLQAAFGWFLSSQDAERALEMIGALWMFWSQNPTPSGHRWVKQALKCCQQSATNVQTDTRAPAVQSAVCLVVMGAIVALQKQYTRAARLWGKAKALYKTRDGRLSELAPYEWVTTLLNTNLLYTQMMEAVRTQLGEPGFTTAWNEGQAMTLEQLLVQPATKSSTPAKVSVTYSDVLTPRERDVLHLLAQGLSSALIAEQLVIGLATVNSHVRTIYSKLGVSCRSAATRYAMEHHLA